MHRCHLSFDQNSGKQFLPHPRWHPQEAGSLGLWCDTEVEQGFVGVGRFVFEAVKVILCLKNQENLHLVWAAAMQLPALVGGTMETLVLK